MVSPCASAASRGRTSCAGWRCPPPRRCQTPRTVWSTRATTPAATRSPRSRTSRSTTRRCSTRPLAWSATRAHSAGSMPAGDATRWQIVLLLACPVLSVGYLLAIRAGKLEPRYGPVIVLATLPAAVLVGSLVGLRTAPPGEGASHAGMLALAVLELAWTVIALAMVGFAIAWRSG